MKTFFFIISMVIALILDALLVSLRGTIIPLFVVMTACYWFWRLTLLRRLLLAFGIGLLLDIIGFLPAGAHIIALVAIAFLCEPMKAFFSNNESRAIIVLNVFMLIIMFQLVTPFAERAAVFMASLL